MKRIFLFAFFASLIGFSLTASADTLQLTGTGGASTNNVYVYPYYFTATTGGKTATNVSLMCIDYNKHITQGEKWTISEGTIPTDSSLLSADYRALALIFFGASTNYPGANSSEYQFAAWSIFDPTDMANQTGANAFDSTAQMVASTAMQMALGNLALPAGFSYSNYELFLPTSDTTGWTDGTPQRFIGAITPGSTPTPTPNVIATPEPSSLMLLGTGIVGMAFVMRRKQLFQV